MWHHICAHGRKQCWRSVVAVFTYHHSQWFFRICLFLFQVEERFQCLCVYHIKPSSPTTEIIYDCEPNIIWMLKIKSVSFTRWTSVLHTWVISLGPFFFVFETGSLTVPKICIFTYTDFPTWHNNLPVSAKIPLELEL